MVSKRRQRSRVIDFFAGGEDVLALVEGRLATDQCFGRLATQALLCRAGLRLLATAPREVTERAIREQLRIELRTRYPVVFGDDDPGPDGGPVESEQAGAA
jgi:hypothetical protein